MGKSSTNNNNINSKMKHRHLDSKRKPNFGFPRVCYYKNIMLVQRYLVNTLKGIEVVSFSFLNGE